MRILGLGDNVVDKYLHTGVMYPGGNAYNIAALASLSGAEAGYLGVFGEDEAGKHVYQTAKDLGIDVSLCRFYPGENGYAEVRLDNGDRVFVGSNQGGVSREHPLVLSEVDLSYISTYDVCHTSIFSYTEDILPQIRDASPFVSMDFSNRYDEEYLKRCCPYLDMAEISCSDMSREEIISQMERIRSYGCRELVLATRGSAGAILMAADKVYEQSPCLVEATDTMGAGDSFITSFILHYVEGSWDARDFPEESGKLGITTKADF
ncbi:MAG: carbohydrate kinase, partial [Blautia sp.]|nr:carbohydrate kinase [Blautia sp.]